MQGLHLKWSLSQAYIVSTFLSATFDVSVMTPFSDVLKVSVMTPFSDEITCVVPVSSKLVAEPSEADVTWGIIFAGTKIA